MSQQFLKTGDLQLINGGYLVNKEGQPVSNKQFELAQEKAHYVVTFANLAKGKNFKASKVDSLHELRVEVLNAINTDKAVVFVEKPTPVTRELTDQLAKEAMSFMDFQKDSSRVDQVNAYMQQFKVLKEFNDFGLYFTSDIVKLQEIYTLDQVIEAVNSCIDLL